MSLTFLAEIGSNWKRDTSDASFTAALDSIRAVGQVAKRFPDFRFVAKFQYWTDLYSPTRAPEQWQRAQEYRLPGEWLVDLWEACSGEKVSFCLSFFEPETLKDVSYLVNYIKLASGSITHRELIQTAAIASGVFEIPLLLSTGAATAPEIRQALIWARKEDPAQLVLMNCVSKYPAAPEDYDLARLPYRDLCDAYGLSDHTLNSHLLQEAVKMGYTYFEKHVRLDDTPATCPDYGHAVDFGRFQQYVRTAKRYFDFYYRGPRLVLKDEEPERIWARVGSDGLRPAEVGK